MGTQLRPLQLLVALCATVALLPQLGLCNMFDPCGQKGQVVRGDAYVIGLALFPGGNASNIALQIAASSPQLGLCNTSLQNEMLTQYPGARVAVFQLKLDRLQVLRLPYPDIIFSIANAANATMTVVAFRDNVLSVPAYLANGSNDTSIHGAGFVVSLALLLNFNTGTLDNMYWYDLTCNACGGKSSQICIQQINVNSCATPFTNCTCINQGTNCSYSDSKFDSCSTAINVGFSGTDSNSAVFQTGAQLQRLNAYSLTSLFYKAQSAVLGQYNSIYSNIASDWGQLQSDSKNQQLDFGGSIGTAGRPPATGSSPPPSPSPPTPPAPPGTATPSQDEESSINA